MPRRGVTRRPFSVLALGVKVRLEGGVYVKVGFNSIARWNPQLWDASWTGQGVLLFAEGEPGAPDLAGDAPELLKEVEIVG